MNEGMKSVLSKFAGRKRLRSTTDLNRLKIQLIAKNEFDPAAFDETFKALETAQAGKTEGTTFKWTKNMRMVAKSILGVPQNQIEEEEKAFHVKPPYLTRKARKMRGRPKGSKNRRPRLVSHPGGAGSVPTPLTSNVVATASNIVVFANIQNKKVGIVIPSGLTQVEADGLADTLRSLPSLKTS